MARSRKYVPLIVAGGGSYAFTTAGRRLSRNFGGFPKERREIRKILGYLKQGNRKRGYAFKSVKDPTNSKLNWPVGKPYPNVYASKTRAPHFLAHEIGHIPSSIRGRKLLRNHPDLMAYFLNRHSTARSLSTIPALASMGLVKLASKHPRGSRKRKRYSRASGVALGSSVALAGYGLSGEIGASARGFKMMKELKIPVKGRYVKDMAKALGKYAFNRTHGDTLPLGLRIARLPGKLGNKISDTVFDSLIKLGETKPKLFRKIGKIMFTTPGSYSVAGPIAMAAIYKALKLRKKRAR